MAASALPPPSKNPLLVPRRETRTSWRRDPGNSARPAATPGPPGGDFTSPAQRAGGGAAVKAVKPALNTQRGHRTARALRPLFSSPGPPPSSLLADRKLLPSRLRPTPQRPGSDRRQLLQSGQEEGGSPESGAPGVLLHLLLPPRLHRRLSDSSFCRSRRGASETTRAEHYPAGASSAAASGAHGAADRLAVQILLNPLVKTL
ncbi:hypothetical protein ABFV05_003222 [Capra hircus]